MSDASSDHLAFTQTPNLRALKRALDKALIACFDHVKPGGMTPAQEEAWELDEVAVQARLKAARLRYDAEREMLELLNAEIRPAAAGSIEDSMVDQPDEEMLTARDVCQFFGGSGRPIDISTLYRGIRQGRYPKPIKITPKINRWRRSECQAALDAMMTAREIADT